MSQLVSVDDLQEIEAKPVPTQHDVARLAHTLREAMGALEAAGLALTWMGVSDDGRHEHSQTLLNARRLSRGLGYRLEGVEE